MKAKRGTRLGMLLLIVTLFLISLSHVSGYTRSQNPGIGLNIELDNEEEFDKSQCESGKDFLVQLKPFSCAPAIVRSDLLEEQNVNVYCQMGATQINPLVDVKGIENIYLSGDFPKDVANVKFYPARAALGSKTKPNSPVLDNIGYAVITLRRNPNESSMPEFVEGNLTARLNYDAEEVFGLGRTSFHLPQLTEEQWEEKFKAYGFWAGKGYLRIENVETDRAEVSVYDKNLRRISTSKLKEGETSRPITIPEFNFCAGDMRIKLDDLEDPDTRAKLRINSQSVEVTEGEKFLDNRCTVQKIREEGLSQNVKIRCNEDGGRNDFELRIEPRVNLSLKSIPTIAERGDLIYEFDHEGSKRIFLGYIGEHFDGTPFIVPVVSPAETKEEFLNSAIVKNLPLCLEDFLFGGENKGWLTNIASTASSKICFAALNIGGSYPVGIYEKGEGGNGNNKEREDFINKALDDFFIYIGKKEIWDIVKGNVKDNIKFIDFAGGSDEDLEEHRKKDEGDEFLRNYYEADSSYRTVIQKYYGERYSELNGGPTLDEEASYHLINFAKDFNQKKTMFELCREFKNNYPNSEKNLDICEKDFKFSSKESATEFIYLSGKTKKIEFDGIVKPDFDEYGADVLILNAGDNSGPVKARKNQKIFLSDDEFITLNEVKEDRVVFDDSSVSKCKINERTLGSDVKCASEKIFGSRLKVNLGEHKSFGSENYQIIVVNINLKKYAKVSIIPDVRKSSTEADFGFKIGIEKRNFKLTPEKTRERIEQLNGTIETIEELSGNLGNVTKGLQTACTVTGGILTIKNLFENLGGKGIARQKVMRGNGGWFERCVDLVTEGTYETQEKCLLENADKIDSDVEKVNKIIEEQNTDIKNIEAQFTTDGGFLGDKVVNTEKFIEEYAPSVQSSLSDLNEDLECSQNIEDLLTFDSWKNGNYRTDELREIDLNLRILESDANEELKQPSRERLCSLFTDIQVNSEEFNEKKGVENHYGVSVNFGGDTDLKEKIPILEDIRFSAVKDRFNSYDEINDDEFVQIYVKRVTREKYLLVLDEDYLVKQTYKIGSDNALRVANGDNTNPLRIGFEKVDSGTYRNKFKSSSGDSEPVVRYFETEPYKGFPALVPFDLDNGWYAATKQTLPTGGNIKTFDASGRVNSFALCNVGKNGIEEFNSGLGDDRCTGMNLNTGQPYDQIHGLSEQESRKLVHQAVNAIEEASKRYSPRVREVIINDRKIKVGVPNVDIPDIQCQDFMSPKDCNLLFNVCDPVICPSSRCDLGGEYPVRDVVQSGVIGSLALCLPNIKEGIAVPICLTGVKAGLDYWNSNLKSYQECLQTSLDTKQTVGICDEIHSVYMCEMFWREIRPLTDIIVPKTIEAIAGQNVRGGGEYLSVKDALSRAESSFNYFTQNYADQASGSFKIRSTAEISAPVCKNFASLVFPSGADFFSSITSTELASPPQFSARFDEIPLTDVTVPPTSHYKVFYHIYAGENTGAYYNVFLRADSTSFYQDVASIRSIKSGFIPAGEHVTETPDFSAPSGYRELCINVNGQEKCGFKEVSSSFAVDYVKDRFLENQASQTEITSEAECISGTIFDIPSEIVSSDIYKRNIIRICATDDPGVGSDPFAKTEKSRWRDVGYCGNEKMRCFLDSQSVEDVIKSTKVEGRVLEETANNYLDVLTNSEEFIFLDDIDENIERIERLENNRTKIDEIDSALEKTFLFNAKGYLELLRANTFRELALKYYGELDKEMVGSGEIIVRDSQEGSNHVVEEKEEGTKQEKPTINYNENKIYFESNSEKVYRGGILSLRSIVVSEGDEIIVGTESKNDCTFLRYDVLRKTYPVGRRLIRENIQNLEKLNEYINNQLEPSPSSYLVRGYCVDEEEREERVLSPYLTIQSEEPSRISNIYFRVNGGDKDENIEISEDDSVEVLIELKENNCDEIDYKILSKERTLTRISEDVVFQSNSRKSINNKINELDPGKYQVKGTCILDGKVSEPTKSPLLTIKHLVTRSITRDEEEREDGSQEKQIDKICFKIDGESEEICKGEMIISEEQNIEVTSEENCEEVNYDIFGEGKGIWIFRVKLFGDELILGGLSLEDVNKIINKLSPEDKRKYYVVGYCFYEEEEKLTISPYLVIEEVKKFVREGLEGHIIKYEEFKTLFERYAEENLPADWKENEFKALLVAIAHRQSNIGYPRGEFDDSFLMGYRLSEDNFKGKNTQIKRASQELKSAIEKKYGTVHEEYKSCKDKNPKIDLIKCNLVVYLSLHSKDNNPKRKADEIIGLWDSWIEYFDSQ